MTKWAQVTLRKIDEEVTASVRVSGAQIEATGDSLKDALAMLTDALDENDQPFWQSGAEPGR